MTISHISKKAIPIGENGYSEETRERVQTLINSSFSNFAPKKCISLDELNPYLRKYLTSLILEERGKPA